jgi:hypothetical protein
MAQIVAAAPPFGTTGTGLVAKVGNGVAIMRAIGGNPSFVVLNPTDAASLDLEADAGGYHLPDERLRLKLAPVGLQGNWPDAQDGELRVIEREH